MKCYNILTSDQFVVIKYTSDTSEEIDYNCKKNVFIKDSFRCKSTA